MGVGAMDIGESLQHILEYIGPFAGRGRKGFLELFTVYGYPEVSPEFLCVGRGRHNIGIFFFSAVPVPAAAGRLQLGRASS